MTPAAVLTRLEARIGLEGTPTRLVDVVELELTSFFGLPPIQAAERAEKIADPISRLITARVAECEVQGTIAQLVMVGTALDVVAGYCFPFPDEPPRVAELKRHRLHLNSLLDAIRALTFNEFEQFGARVLEALGASFSQITPHGGDQGIDFYGHLNLGQYQELPPPFFKLAHDVRVSFAGQAKHYPNATLGPNTVRELAGAISLARADAFSRENIDIFDDVEIKSYSPLVVLLFTTGKISSGAMKLANAAGMIARSGEQIALFLADKGIGMRGGAEGPTFARDLFDAWIRGNA